MNQFKLIVAVLIVTTLTTCITENALLVNAQNNGLKIAPIVKWTDNKDGNFDFCIYKGNISFSSSVENQPRYCIVSSDDPTLKNMYTSIDDGMDTYQLDDIVIPPNEIKDGQEYTVCVGFTPLSSADYSIAEHCQSFRNTQGSHVETPLINLDDNACYDCDYD